MREARWWMFWGWFRRREQLTVRVFRSDGSEVDLTRSIAERKEAERG